MVWSRRFATTEKRKRRTKTVAWWTTFILGKGRAGQCKWRSADWRRQLQIEKPTIASCQPPPLPLSPSPGPPTTTSLSGSTIATGGPPVAEVPWHKGLTPPLPHTPPLSGPVKRVGPLSQRGANQQQQRSAPVANCQLPAVERKPLALEHQWGPADSCWQLSPDLALVGNVRAHALWQ